MRGTRLRFLLVCILSAALVGGCTSCNWAPKYWEKAEEDMILPAGGLESLRVETHNGDVTLNGSEGADSLAVHVTISAGGTDQVDALACLEAIELVNSVEDGVQKLGWQWAVERKRTWQACVEFDVVMPASLAVSVETHNGGVETSNLDAGAELRTHNGDVTITDVNGTLDAETHNGRIKADAVGERIKLLTHNGEIEPNLTAGDIHIETHNGDISGRVDSPGVLNGKLITHNGSVYLSLGDGISAKVVGSTENGKVKVNREMAVTVQKKRFVVGAVGAGEGSLEIDTHNGSITID